MSIPREYPLDELSKDIADTLRESLLVLDSDLRVLMANRSFYETFEVSKQEAIGQFIYDLGDHAWKIPELQSLLFSIIRQKTTVENFEVDTEFPHIGRRIMLLNARRLKNSDDSRELILVAIEDITARVHVERALALQSQELARSNEDLQQFAYVSSHDLQEPLRMITSYLKLLKKRYHGQLDANADEFIDFAVDGATRMQTLIDDLLAYSRIGTKGKPFVSADCNTLLRYALSNLEVAIRESGALITTDPLPTVVVDQAQMTQVFQNLVGNAIKFRGERVPEIQISARPDGSNWRFSVRDNGIGIEAQFAERIFVIFQRLNRREEYAGTGIGLAICKKVIERQGGYIWVESEPGQGSTFYFTVPLNRES